MVEEIDSFMHSHGFKRHDYDSCIYLKIGNGSIIYLFIYLFIYVDDMLIVAKGKSEMVKLKTRLSKEFEMDLGAAKKKKLVRKLLEIEN
jgi:hypothetical protein